MSLMNKWFVLSFLLLGIASCSQQKRNSGYAIDLSIPTKDTIYYSDFVDSLGYIPLETKEECLIWGITDAVLADEKLFVFDKRSQAVWGYTSRGDFVTSIYRKGGGPEEYRNAIQFEYDSLGKEVQILDIMTKSVMRYSVDGDYLGKITFDLYPSDFKKVGNGYLLSNLGMPDSIGGVYYFDAAKGESTRLLGRTDRLINTFDWELVGYDDVVSFMAPTLQNQVYHYTASEGLRQKYPFEMLPLPEQAYEPRYSMEDMPDFVRTNHIETTRWIYATYWCATKGLRVFLFDKLTGKYEVGKALVNDLDRVDFIATTSAVDNNRFVFAVKGMDEDSNPQIQILYLK